MDPAKLKRAVVTLTGRLSASPKDGEAALALAEALLRLAHGTRDAQETIRYLRKAIAVDPYDARLRLELRLACLRVGDGKGGAEAFRAAALLDPRTGTAAQGLALLEKVRARPSGKSADKAIEAFEKSGDARAAAAKLVAACYGCVPTADRNRLLKLLPGGLKPLAPSAELVPFMGSLGLMMAYAVQCRTSDKKPTATEKTARKKGFAGILDGLAPWFAAFPGEARLEAVRAAVAILDCEDDALAERILAAYPKLADARLLHLFAQRRLDDLEAPRRAEILEAVAARAPLAAGLDRALLLALNAAARAKVSEGAVAEAEPLWRRGAVVDPYNPALHHNLALLALARRDGAAYAAHARADRDLCLGYWLLAPDRGAWLSRLAAKHESFGARLRKEVEAALDAQGTRVDGEHVSAWVGESLAHLTIYAMLLRWRDGAAPPQALREQFVAWLRALPAVAGAGEPPPPELAAFLDPPISGQPPLHYETLGAAADAPPSLLAKRYQEAREELRRSEARAEMEGNRKLAEQVRERIGRLEEAWGVLSDMARRKRYDAECIPAHEHAFHMARRQFVKSLHDFANGLVEKEQADLAPLCVRAYRLLPHERMDPYFDAMQPGARHIIRTNLLSLQFRGALERAQEHMKAERWQEALQLLRVVVSHGGESLSWAQYLLAISEMKVEGEHVEKHKRVSAPGVAVATDARARLKAMPEAAETPDDVQAEVLRRLMEMMAAQRRQPGRT